MEPTGRFEDWTRWRARLIELFYRTREIARDLERAYGDDGDGLGVGGEGAGDEGGAGRGERGDRYDRLGHASESLARETFRIMVFGDFSSGKSTLINAMLGKELLPTKENPTTAFTTMLRWGDTPGAELFREQNGHPETVSVDEFTRQVELDLYDGQNDARSPYLYGVVYWPFPLLASSVELIDSAGTNESVAREAITLDFLPKVDAIVFVTTAKGAFKKHDQEQYLNLLRTLGHSDIFFVVNQFDLIRKDSDREGVRKRCAGIVADYTDRPERIFFTSALDALDAITDPAAGSTPAGDEVTRLYDALAQFCVAERSRIKILRPAEVLRREVLELRQRGARRRGLLLRSAEDLQLDLDRKKETKQSLELTVARIETALSAWVEETERFVATEVENHILKVLPDVEADWLADLPKKPSPASVPRNRGERWRAEVQRVDDFLDQRLQRELYLFGIDPKGLAGSLATRQEMLENSLPPLLRDYEGQLAGLRTALLGADEAADARPEPGHLDGLITGWSALTPQPVVPGLSATSMAGSGSIVLATSGVAAGLVWAGLATAMVAGPVALALAAVGVPIVTGRLRRRQVRTNAAREYREELRRAANEIALRYAERYADSLRAQIETLGGELNRSIHETIDDAEKVIERLRAGRAEAERHGRALAEWEESLGEIENSVGVLVKEVLDGLR
ncbi:dynamin family protein [Spirillospora sp. NBC_01491]|uniref:dynamin family protein n=1 Tax=Spirillospora sp. NBC_01491 TaxID=2976007 RepID=UPI002E30528A|nr:dynamin family protein [Spirillospora sp. NBC_01491]